MAKYKVVFIGFAFVEADSIEDAEIQYWSGISDYEETEVTEVEEIDEFEVVL